MSLFKNLYAYRELLKTNIKKEIRGKYKGSFLGVLWSFINPLLTTLVYAIVFPYLLRGNGIPNYLIFLIVTIIPWNFFTVVISQGGQCIRNEAGIIKKVYFPREILPISIALSGLINFFISSVIVVCFLVGSGIGLSWNFLFLPIIAIVQMLFSLALVFMISSINVYIKDLEYIVNFIVQMLFYGTPILYGIDTIKDANAPWWVIKLVEINPMTTIMNSYRDILYYKQMFDLKPFLFVSILSLVLIVIGYLVFKKLEKGFVEEL